MNLLAGNELYNINVETEYNNILIDKNIDDYFNNIINKPIIHTNQIKSGGGINKFYTDYIEHNLIFIVVLVGIIIFLIIRYYIKDFDTNINTEPNDDIKMKKYNIKINNKAKKLEHEKLKLINYKKELDSEKQKILSIIDELSNINDYESKKNEQIYLYKKNQMNQMNQMNQLNQMNQIQNYNVVDKSIYKDNIMETNYYDFNNRHNDKNNEIDGLYIEPPFM